MKKSQLKKLIKEEIKSLYELSGEEKLLSDFNFGPWPINDEGEADPGWAYDEDFIINFKDHFLTFCLLFYFSTSKNCGKKFRFKIFYNNMF